MTIKSKDFDAIVIGSGPNGLAAAITLAQTGRSVVVYEAEDTIGGGARSAELTLPGFIHDICSCVHPMAAGSPFFQQLGLERFGLRWIFPEIALAHPFDDGDAAAVGQPFEQNLEQFGEDAKTIRSLMGGMVQSWPELSQEILGPPHIPNHPLKMAMFGWLAIQSARKVARKLTT